MTTGHATRQAHETQDPLHHRRRMLTGLGLAWVGWIAACSTTPVSRPAEPAPRTPVPYNTVRNDLALFALSLLDTPYKWGGRGPATGFDCSGLVAYVYREGGGIHIQGTSAELGRKSKLINRSAILPGDLVFFNTLNARHSHVGVYVGGGRFVHAPNPRTRVRVDHLSNSYYAQRFEGAHTLLD